jgi:FkbM family methyltransferase
MRLKNQHFFIRWFNERVFPLFYLRHQGKSAVVVEAQSGTRFKVRVNTSDILVVWEIWSAKIYDDKRFPIAESDVVVDIGAHIGVFAVRAARQAHRGRVYAYEAYSKNYALLAENRQLNDLDNLHIDNRAVSGHRGEMNFYVPGDNGALGSFLQETDSPMEVVQAMTLADIIAEHSLEQIDYLKVDVEGAEYEILSNCSQETLAKVRCVVMEYHEFVGDTRTHLDLVNLLRSHGFNTVVEGGIFPQKFLFGTGIIKAWRA